MALSEKVKDHAERHLADTEREISDLIGANDREHGMMAEYIDHLRSHRDMWRNFLGLDPAASGDEVK